MSESITVRGTLLEDGTLRLAAPVALPPGEVEVVIRPVPQQGELASAVLARIHAEQKASGHVPRSAEEIDAYVRELRDEWEERYNEIEAIQKECQQARENRSGETNP